MRARGLAGAAALAGALELGGTMALAAEEASPRESQPAGPLATFAEVRSLGPVTYAEASADLPLAEQAVLVPEVELLYLAPVEGDPRRELHPFAGLGLTIDEPEHWDWGLSITYGPRAYGVSTLAASVQLAKDFEADGDPSPPLLTDAALSLNVEQFAWRPPSSFGATVVQLYADASARLALSERFVLRPRAMYFLYDRVFTPATVDEVASLSLLARVGTFAPRLFAGVRLTWKATASFYPLAEIAELLYVGEVGSGTQLDAGVRARLGAGVVLTLAGGVLRNHLTGVASTLGDQRTVPLLEARCEVSF